MQMLVACGNFGARPEPAKADPGGFGAPPAFTLHQAVYDQTPAEDTSIEISLADQRARVMDREGRVLLETQVSTGVAAHPTPTGTFRVLAKKVDKRSNIYGSYVDGQSGEVVVARAWTHVGPSPPGTLYRGISMPYWMRLNWGGVGMHVGDFSAGHRSSHGCIRVPEHVQPLIYAKALVGTTVEILP
jgi:lipoprotein-anchoring transpeptidase ErfK/SrfK